MPSMLDRLADLAPERVRPLRRIDYERLAAEGAFDDERVELLDGVIVEMSPQDPRHAGTVERLTALLAGPARDRAALRPQLPLAISESSLPEPDLALVPLGNHVEAHPEQAYLVIEVANSSLRKDRLIKGDLYARAGVPEYWVVNVLEGAIEVHTEPKEGIYTKLLTARSGDSLPVRCLGSFELAVADVLR